MRNALILCTLLATACGDDDDDSPPMDGAGTDGASDSAGGDAGTDAVGDDAPVGDAPGADAGADAVVDPTFFVLDDPLKGSTFGNVVGGEVTADGWLVNDRTDRVWFEIPRLVDGAIEFTISGASLDGSLGELDDAELFTMYDAGYGMEEPVNYNPEYRNNFFKSMIRVYGTEPSRLGQQKLLWINCAGGSPGYADDGCPCEGSFAEEPFGGDGTWDGSPQRLRVEWTHDGGARYLRNGVEVLSVEWGPENPFGPELIHFTLGTPRAPAVGSVGVPVGAVFSDLHVEGHIGDAVASCI